MFTTLCHLPLYLKRFQSTPYKQVQRTHQATQRTVSWSQSQTDPNFHLNSNPCILRLTCTREDSLSLFNGHFSNFFEALMRAGSVPNVEGSGRDGGYNGPRLVGHDDTMVQRGLSPGPSHSDLKAGLLLGRYSSVGEIR